MLIATSLIMVIRTAKHPAVFDANFSNTDLHAEVEYSIHPASTVRSAPIKHHEAIFPGRKKPWHEPDAEDDPK